MPSWKPDCLKASSTLNHLSNTLENARFINDEHENNSISNESTSIKSNNQDGVTHKSGKGNKHHQQQHDLNSTASSAATNNNKPLSFQNASSKLSIQKGYSLVELTRTNSSQFGLTIAGGTDKDSRPRICDLKPGSIAHRCDELQIGDMIISINGIKTQGLKHEEIIDLIKNAGDTLCLEFEYNLPPWPIHPHHAVRSQTVSIQLEKETSSYGFTIRGGYNNEDKSKSRPLIVTNIRAGGPADREGTLKIGDRIVAINGINILTATLQDAYFILKQCKGLTLFLVEYDSAIVDSIKNSNGPLLIEIEKSPGSSIGIKLTSGKNPLDNKNQILVESVKPASIADRCGAIYAGDQILSIDDVSFEHLSLAEANQILKNCVGEFSRVEILPLSQLHSATKANNQQKSSSKSLVDLNKEYRLVDMQKFGSLNSCSASLNTNQVCHGEKVEIMLRADDNGTFGFTLQGASIVTPTHDMVQSVPLYPVIGYVEPNSVAERCGILQPGDRILSVNKNSLEGLSLEDARQIIKDAGANLNLEIEFDVAETIILSSGIFQVKLLKKNLDLGISVAYSKFTRSENYPVISAIKKGSVAYRSGMLQPGDQILYIDSTCLKNKSLEEISQMLKGNEEIVKLKIKKDEVFTEETIDEKNVVYTVELEKNGGPLGITISGSDDLFEPMFVSSLSEGGLAERTNAIHVGDVILAINNVSLKGKPLIEAIDLLKNAGDLVTLKISRKITPQQQNKMHQASPMKQPPPEPHQQLPYHYHHQYHHPESNSTPQKYLNNPNRSLNDATAQQQQSPQQQMHIKNMPPMGRTVTNSYESNAASGVEKINGSTPYGYHQQHQQQSFSTNGNGAGFNSGSRGGGISAASSVAEKPNDNSDFINSEYQKSLQYLPFPIDMNSFMKDSPNKTTSNPNKYLSNNNLMTTTTSTTTCSSSSSNSSSCSSSNLSSGLNTTAPLMNTSFSRNNNNNLINQNNNNNNLTSSPNTNNNLNSAANNNYELINNNSTPKLNHRHYNNNNNHNHTHINEDCSIKKKAASIDSINAVERELDEVLKDLELNSQDLNDHLEGTAENGEYNGVVRNVIELPITIQKNIKIEQCASSSSPLFNKPSPYQTHHHVASAVTNGQYAPQSLKWTYGGVKMASTNSPSNVGATNMAPPSGADFSGSTRQNFELYIEDSAAENDEVTNDYNNKKPSNMVPSNGPNRLFNGGPQMHSNQPPSANNNPNAKRQNIVSTYELCHECYDTNGAHTHNNCMRNSNNNNNQNNQNNTSNHMMFSNRLANASNNSTPSKTSIQQHLLNGNKPPSCSSPNKMMSSSNSNHELRQPSSSYQQYHQHGFNGTAAANNNNNVESSSVLGNASNQHHNNSNNSETNTTSVSQQNGHVVSQKTISIGLPTNSAATNTESKSTTNVKNEEKLDRLPPVPPSAWSANSSMKRRNQFYQNNYQPQQQQQQSTPSTQQQSSITNSRLKKFNVQNNNINGGKEQSPTDTQQQPQQQQASFTTYQQQQTSANQTKQLNGHHYGENETTSKSTELNIGENEHDQQPQKETATATTNQG